MRFGQWWSGKSRKSHLVSEMGDHITDPLIEYAREYAGAERPDYFIFGHMHQPRDYSEGICGCCALGSGTPIRSMRSSTPRATPR